MIKYIGLFLCCFWGVLIYGQPTNRLIIKFNNQIDSIKVRVVSNDIAWPHFTPGIHETDSSLHFQQTASETWSAALTKMSRGTASGKINNGPVIYHISSGPVPAPLADPLTVTVNVPPGKDLLYHGQLFSEPVKTGWLLTRGFHNYYTAREFPIVLLDSGKYLVRYTRVSPLDSVQVVYTWIDSLGQSKLSNAIATVDSTVRQVVNLCPEFWHKYVSAYDKSQFTYLYIISNDVVTGWESCSAPYSITVPRAISAEGVYHTWLHTLIGKFSMPAEYLKDDGHYHFSDALGYYEGLTEFQSIKLGGNNGNFVYFANRLSADIYRAKLAPEHSDLADLSADHKFESWYAKGLLFWLVMQEEGLNVDTLIKLFDRILINSGQTAMQLSDVWRWIGKINPQLGRLAEQYSHGEYLNKAWQILRTNGWSPAPLKDSPYWYNYYIGPYPIKAGGVLLPTDNYPAVAGQPKYLIRSDGIKMLIEAKPNNEALRLFKSEPDKLFSVEFSSGEVLQIKDNLCFSDGTPYFMFGTIKISNPDQAQFWARLDKSFHVK
jgi:hypothetical protein